MSCWSSATAQTKSLRSLVSPLLPTLQQGAAGGHWSLLAPVGGVGSAGQSRHTRLRLGFHVLHVAAALFERSRHACYVLLRGPQPGEGPGTVSLMKRKLKEDVSVSKVIWLRHMAGDDEQHIRDRLYRMRFKSRD